MSIRKWKACLKLPTHVKILRFFITNPSSIDTPRGIATWTSENIEEVRKALEELTRSNLLKAHRTPSTIAYSFTEDKALIAEVTAALRKKP